LCAKASGGVPKNLQLVAMGVKSCPYCPPDIPTKSQNIKGKSLKGYSFD